MVKRGHRCPGPKHQKEKRSMDYFAGLDVSVKDTSVCIVDDVGKIIREVKVRCRDGRYRPPPAQNRASGIPARGSHLGCVTALRDILASCRMRFSACDT